MNARIYDGLTNGCVLIAVVSALFFDRAGGLRWLAGGLGIAAGAAAAGVYFYNQWCSERKHAAGNVEREEAAPSVALTVAPVLALSRGEAESADTAYETAPRWFGYTEPLAARRHAELVKLKRECSHCFHSRSCYLPPWFDIQDVEPQRYVVADSIRDVIRMVNQLSCSEETPAFEFVLTRKGYSVVQLEECHKSFGDQAEEPVREYKTLPLFFQDEPN